MQRAGAEGGMAPFLKAQQKEGASVMHAMCLRVPSKTPAAMPE